MIKDYQYLTGQEISTGHKADIITIAPYSKILQWSFATQLAKQQPGPISIENPSGRYDAVVISYKGGPPGSFVITDLRTVLKQCGIAFHPEKYAAIKEQQPMKRITYNLATAAICLYQTGMLCNLSDNGKKKAGWQIGNR